MSGLVDQLLSVPGWVVLLVTAAVVFAEDALFVGFVLPGETAAVPAGVAAGLGHVPLVAVLAVVVGAAVAGDSVGYEIGRHLGPRVLQLQVLQKRRARRRRACPPPSMGRAAEPWSGGWAPAGAPPVRPRLDHRDGRPPADRLTAAVRAVRRSVSQRSRPASAALAMAVGWPVKPCGDSG